MITIEEVTAAGFPAVSQALAAILQACVAQGASIGFVHPFTDAAAAAFWQGVAAGLGPAGKRLLVARLDGQVVGTGQLDLGQPPNGAHRADVKKVLVHPEAQRRGIGRLLMIRLEALARDAGRSLLILDTRTGDGSDLLYRSLGFQPFGIVPGYARSPDGVSEDCTFFYKQLA